MSDLKHPELATGVMRPAFLNNHLRVVILRNDDLSFRIRKDRITIGSVESADVRLPGDGISPIHAVIEISAHATGVTATLYDLASQSGVFVNGKKVVTHIVNPGDEITVGVHHLFIALEDPISVKEEEKNEEDLAPLLLTDSTGIDPIFDFDPNPEPRALEVVMSWMGTILDVRHFVTEEGVTIGDKDGADFIIPPLTAHPIFQLVTRRNDGLILNLDGSMEGVLQRDGRLETIQQIRNRTGAGTSPQTPLKRGDFAKVSIKDVDFYLSFSVPPPHLKRKKIIAADPFFYKTLGTSMAVTLALVFTLLKIPAPQPIEPEQLPDRIATILYQPEKYPSQITQSMIDQKMKDKSNPPPVEKIDLKPNGEDPKKEAKDFTTVKKQPDKNKNSAKVAQQKAQRGQKEGKEGAGARAKGKEGKRGVPNAHDDGDPQNVAKRPSAQAGKGAGGGNSQVSGEGNVDFLKGASAKIQDLLGSSSAKLGKGGDKLQGYGAFNTKGDGGLALSGVGKGGGGNAASLGGLADKGRGGGRVGTGEGAAGNASGIVGGKARVAIRTGGVEEAVVMGSIDAGAVEAALLAHRDEFRLCYEREINATTPNISGRVGTSFVIGPSGRVTRAGIESSSLKNENVEKCLLTVIKRIDFPIPRGGGIVQVTYPFKFSSGR